MGDPVIISIIVGGAAVILLALVTRLWRRGRDAAYNARRRAERRKQRRYLETQQQETERLADRILATSSTSSIAGYTIVRQIEAVFTDGHPSSTRAIQFLKAVAARKGANAVINLNSARPPSGKCVASGDAVIVRPIEAAAPATPSLPPIPPIPPPGEDESST